MIPFLLARGRLPLLLAGCAAAGLLTWGVSLKLRLSAERVAHAMDLQAHADYVAQAEAAAREAVESARQKEAQYRVGLAKAFEQFEKEKLDAFRREEKLRADLRAGRVRLRQSICPGAAPGNGVPADAGSAAGVDGGADDGATIVAAAVRAGAECDAQVRGLQAVIRGYVGQ